VDAPAPQIHITADKLFVSIDRLALRLDDLPLIIMQVVKAGETQLSSEILTSKLTVGL